MFNKAQASELQAMILLKLTDEKAGQADKRPEIATKIVEMVQEYLAKRYSTPTPSKNVGVHTFAEALRKAPEDKPQ